MLRTKTDLVQCFRDFVSKLVFGENGTLDLALLLRNRFVQVQNHLAYRGQRSKLGGVDV